MGGFGSSPHTRGTHALGQVNGGRLRFIPAYAGNAAGAAQIFCPYAVHPRIRGERQVGTCRTRISPGSSPHTRGTLDGVQFRQIFGRFIPAYAGNAPGSLPSQWPGPVHPRIRGERLMRFLVNTCYLGSSPHTRGTQPVTEGIALVRRFIPAYAGNATAWPDRRPLRTVHPRIRGERSHEWAPNRVSAGSSPHTRGTLEVGWQNHHTGRFIPAYAGNASTSLHRRVSAAVHPRIRGECAIPCSMTP